MSEILKLKPQNTPKVIFKARKKEAKDGRNRFVIIAMDYNSRLMINIGFCIATADHYDEDLGTTIALDRAVKKRKKLQERALQQSLPVGLDHMRWLKDNPAMAHSYADYLIDQFMYNLDDIIWPE